MGTELSGNFPLTDTQPPARKLTSRADIEIWGGGSGVVSREGSSVVPEQTPGQDTLIFLS